MREIRYRNYRIPSPAAEIGNQRAGYRASGQGLAAPIHDPSQFAAAIGPRQTSRAYQLDCSRHPDGLADFLIQPLL